MSYFSHPYANIERANAAFDNRHVSREWNTEINSEPVYNTWRRRIVRLEFMGKAVAALRKEEEEALVRSYNQVVSYNKANMEIEKLVQKKLNQNVRSQLIGITAMKGLLDQTGYTPPQSGTGGVPGMGATGINPLVLPNR